MTSSSICFWPHLRCLPFSAAQLGVYNYAVGSGWVTTNAALHSAGPGSWAWSAKVTFTVAGPSPTVFIVTDRNWVSELPAIFDLTGTTVRCCKGGLSACMPLSQRI
jgi:hypothetical protein